MGTEAWVVFTRLSSPGVTSDHSSCMGVAWPYQGEESRKRHTHGDDAIVLFSQENVQLVGYHQPPMILPYVRWRVFMQYANSCDYNTPLASHIGAPSSSSGGGDPKIKMVEIVHGTVFGEHAVLCPFPRRALSFTTKALHKNIRGLPESFNLASLMPPPGKPLTLAWINSHAIRLQVGNAYAWVMYAMLCSQFESESFINDAAVMNAIHPRYPCLVAITMDGESPSWNDVVTAYKSDVEAFVRKILGGMRRKDHAKELVLPRCLLQKMPLKTVEAYGDLMDTLWPCQHAWRQRLVVGKALHEFRDLIMSQSMLGPGSAFCVGVNIADLPSLKGSLMGPNDRSLLSRHVRLEGERIFSFQMIETIDAVCELFSVSTTSVRCVVHRGILSRTWTPCGCDRPSYTFDFGQHTEGLLSALSSRARVKDLVIKNFHLVTPETAMDTITGLHKHGMETITFTFDPSGCIPGMHYNWCVALCAKCLHTDEKSVTYADADVSEIFEGVKFVICDRKDALKRMWNASDGPGKRGESDVVWIKASIDVDDETDAKEDMVPRVNSWVTSHEFIGSFGIISSISGCVARVKVYSRHEPPQVKASVSLNQLTKIHALPSDIMSVLQKDSFMEVRTMGVYAPQGVGPRSGWDKDHLNQCLSLLHRPSKRKPVVYIYSEDPDKTLQEIRSLDPTDRGCDGLTMHSRRHRDFLEKELMTLDSIHIFRQQDICLDRLLSS